MVDADGLSMVAENYLASIYRLEEERETITVVRLAEMLRRTPATERLGSTLPSVLSMLRRLAKDELVEFTLEKAVRPTPRGQQVGEGVVRRHRLAECWLAQSLGLDLSLVHTEAHRIEHAMSVEVERHLDAFLGHPTACPFGYPIPGNAALRRVHARTLTQAGVGEQCVVDRIPEDDVQLLGYLVSNGVLPNKSIVVQEVAPYKGIVTVEVDQRMVAIGHHVADGIRVRRSE